MGWEYAAFAGLFLAGAFIGSLCYTIFSRFSHKRYLQRGMYKPDGKRPRRHQKGESTCS